MNLQERGVAAAAARMGWHEGEYAKQKGWYYPLFNVAGQKVTNKGQVVKRWKNANSDGSPKYGWSKAKDEQDNLIWSYYMPPNFLEEIKLSLGDAWLIGGDIDNLTLQEAGVMNVFNLFGERNWPDSFVSDLEAWGVTTLYYPFDLDKTGVESAYKLGIYLAENDYKGQYIPLLWPAEIGSKFDANRYWQELDFDKARFHDALFSLEAVDPADYLEDEPDTQEHDAAPVRTKPIEDRRDLPAAFYEAIERALGVNGPYDKKGWSKNKVLCPFHDDHTPNGVWNREKHIFKCFVCHGNREFALAKEVGERLNIRWQDFIDHSEPVRTSRVGSSMEPDDPEPSDEEPHYTNTQYEGLLLALIIQQSDRYYELDPIPPSSFELPRHNILMTAIDALALRGEIFDAAALEYELETTGQLESVGKDYLQRLQGLEEANPNHLGLYAERIKTAAYRRRVKGIGTNLIKISSQPGKRADLAEDVETALSVVSDEPQDMPIVSTKAGVAEHMARVQTRLETGDGVVGYGTGLEDVDDILRVYKKNLCIVAARPRMGKTAFLLSWLRYFTLKYGPAALISMEMSSDEIISRLIAQEGGLNVANVLEGNLSTAFDSELGTSPFNAYLAAARRVAAMPIYILDKSGVTPSQVMSFYRRCIRQYGVKVGLLDYLQLMSAGGLYKDNRIQQVSYCARSLKDIAATLDIPVIAAAQLSRAAEGKTPSLEHLAQSGEIEAAANQIVALRRLNPNNPQDNTAKVYILKQRNRGTGVVDVSFRPHCTRFDNLLK